MNQATAIALLADIGGEPEVGAYSPHNRHSQNHWFDVEPGDKGGVEPSDSTFVTAVGTKEGVEKEWDVRGRKLNDYAMTETREPWREGVENVTWRWTDGNKPVGLFDFQIYDRKEGKQLVVNSTALQDDYLGKGLGMQMYVKALKYAQDNGFARMSTLGSGASPSAARVWEGLKRRGYPVEETTGKYSTPHTGHRTFRILFGEMKATAQQGWIGFDLDGTLAEYHGFVSDTYIGKPIEKMIDKLKHYLAIGTPVKIFTARAKHKIAVTAIQEWCKKYIGRALPVTDRKDESMLKLYDDRAVSVKTNTGQAFDNKVTGYDNSLGYRTVKAVGTSEGAKKAWDARGRGRKVMPASDRATSSKIIKGFKIGPVTDKDMSDMRAAIKQGTVLGGRPADAAAIMDGVLAAAESEYDRKGVYIARDHEHGLLGGIYVLSSEDKHTMVVADLAAHPHIVAGITPVHGVGTALMQHAAQLAVDDPACQRLHLLSMNFESDKFYTAIGMHDEDGSGRFSWPREDCEQFAKYGRIDKIVGASMDKSFGQLYNEALVKQRVKAALAVEKELGPPLAGKRREVKAIGTKEGVEHEWDTRGRGKKKMPQEWRVLKDGSNVLVNTKTGIVMVGPGKGKKLADNAYQSADVLEKQRAAEEKQLRDNARKVPESYERRRGYSYRPTGGKSKARPASSIPRRVRDAWNTLERLNKKLEATGTQSGAYKAWDTRGRKRNKPVRSTVGRTEMRNALVKAIKQAWLNPNQLSMFGPGHTKEIQENKRQHKSRTSFVPVHATGTSEGAEKAWDERGRGRKSLKQITSILSTAAQARQCALISYLKDEASKPKAYLVEPYSYRGDRFFGYDVDAKSIKAFSLLRITDAKVHNRSFNARWPVELSAFGEPDVPMTGGHIDPIPTFHPPSLRNPQRVPVDDPRETDDRFLDVTMRKKRWDDRMNMLRRAAPAGLPALVPVRTTAVQHHMGVYQPGMFGAAQKPKPRVPIRQRPARIIGSKRTHISYDRRGSA